MKATLAETWERFRCDFVAVLDGYQFLEIAGDRKAYLGDFGPRRGWLKHKSSEGLVKGRRFPPSRVEILGGLVKGRRYPPSRVGILGGVG